MGPWPLLAATVIVGDCEREGKVWTCFSNDEGLRGSGSSGSRGSV